MRFQKSGGRARIFFPADIRDDYSLEGYDYIGVEIKCREEEPVASLTPTNNEEEFNISRQVTIQSNGQARMDFPKQVAQSLGFLQEDISLERGDESSLIIKLSE
jgi:hypothetical protein